MVNLSESHRLSVDGVSRTRCVTFFSGFILLSFTDFVVLQLLDFYESHLRWKATDEDVPEEP